MLSIPRRRKTDVDPASNAWPAQLRRLQDQVSALKALLEFTRCLASEPALDTMLVQTVSFAGEVVRAEMGALYLFDPETGTLALRAVLGDQVAPDRHLPIDQGIVGAVWTSKQPIRIDDPAQAREQLSSGEDLGLVVRSLLAIPLAAGGNAIGVLQVLNKQADSPFDDTDEELLQALAAHAAAALERTRRSHQIVAERDLLLDVEAQVRRRLARDLHDGPSQLLSAMIMNVRFLKKILPHDSGRSYEELSNLENVAAQALQQVRTMLIDLRTIQSESHDLGSAIKAYVDRQRENLDARIQFDWDEQPVQCSPVVQAAALSFVQHAVSNVRKHAHAQHIWITVRRRADMLGISVKDDGCGFDVQQIEKTSAERGSLGLLEMKERAVVARGQLTVESTPGHGTALRLLVPLQKDLSPK